MKKIIILLIAIITLFSCENGLDTSEEYVNPTKPTSNEKIITEKIWKTDNSSAYAILKGKDDLYYIRGRENSVYYVAGIDASLNTLWKKSASKEYSINSIVPFNYNDKSLVLVTSSSSTTEKLSIYDEGGNNVSEVASPFLTNGKIRDVKLAGLPVGDVFYFVMILENKLDKKPLLACISYKATTREFSENFNLVEFDIAKEAKRFYSFVFDKNPQTTLATQNNSIVAWLDNNCYQLNLPDLYTSSGNNYLTASPVNLEGLPSSYQYYNDNSLCPQYSTAGSLEKIYLPVLNEKSDSGVYYETTLLALDGQTFKTKWNTKINITKHSDRFYKIVLFDNIIRICGYIDGYQRKYSKKQFRYGAIVKIDPLTGGILTTETFGNDYFSSGFNDFIVDNNEFIAIGWTGEYVSSGVSELAKWAVDFTAGNYNQWMVKIKK